MGTEEETISIVAENITQRESEQQLLSGTTYFWQVITVDREANSSESIIREFTTE